MTLHPNYEFAAGLLAIMFAALGVLAIMALWEIVRGLLA